MLGKKYLAEYGISSSYDNTQHKTTTKKKEKFSKNVVKQIKD